MSSSSSSGSSSSFKFSSSFINDLKTKGYAVVPNVLSSEECEKANEGLWKWLGEFSENKIKRDDPTTWEINWPYNMGKKGIIQQYKIAHTQFVWDVRQNPKVKKVFERIWSDDDLLSSYDGINVQIPPEITKKYADPLGIEWHHMDQSTTRPDFECIQGFIDINGTDLEDGCLIVREKSHLLVSEYAKQFNIQSKKDWVKLEPDHNKWYDEKGSKPIRVTCPQGSLVLWDSRTVHANSTALKSRNKPDKFRFVIYTCMTPRKLANDTCLRKKQHYYNEGRVTSHWPHKIKTFPKVPHLYNQVARYKPGLDWAENNYKKPTLTEEGKRLAGF